jgi:hypothetical protein
MISYLCSAFCAGENGRMYEANVDDVGYRLVAIYTPVREDGVEGRPVSASTEPIAVGIVKLPILIPVKKNTYHLPQMFLLLLVYCDFINTLH